MPHSSAMPSATLQRPADQSFQFTVGERTRIFFDASLGDRRVQQGAHVAMKFVLKRRNKFRQARSERGDADGLDALLPSVLIISRYGKNLFEQHRGSQVGAVGRQFGAAIAAEDAIAGDDGGKRRTRNTRKQR